MRRRSNGSPRCSRRSTPVSRRRAVRCRRTRVGSTRATNASSTASTPKTGSSRGTTGSSDSLSARGRAPRTTSSPGATACRRSRRIRRLDCRRDAPGRPGRRLRQPAGTSAPSCRRDVDGRLDRSRGGARTTRERSAGHVRIRGRRALPASTGGTTQSGSGARARPHCARVVARRPGDGQPRDRDHRPRRAGGGQEFSFPFAHRVVHGAEGRGRRRRQHGEQPRARLRTRGHAGHLQRDRVVQIARGRDRAQRGGGVSPLSHRDPRAAHRDLRGARLARARAHPGVVRHRHAARCRDVDRPYSPRRGGPRGPARGRHVGGVPPLGNRGDLLRVAGADIVVGSHAHRVFGAGKVGTALVAYGLGNFVYWREDGESGRSGVLLVTATGREVDTYSWVPARITNGVPVPETGGPAAADVTEWQRRRTCSGLAP
ncbi:MAG: CapA family protein [Actinobacteria bacterium]|nr:MAG: CapA family protein [Actinomycetota bacterium]